MAIDPTNYINTWNNSSVLQQQFPDVNDYVDLFGSSSTPSTPLISSTPSTPGIESLMQPKIIDDFNDSGDQGNPPGGNTNAGYGYSGVDGFSLGDIGEGTVDKDDYTFGMQVNDAVRGAKTTLSGLPDRVKDYVKSGGLLGLGVKGVGKVFNYGRNVLSQGLQSLRDKQAEEKSLADAMAVAQAEIDRMGYKDYGQGAATGGGGYNDGDGGSYSGASTDDYGGGEKDGGFIDGTNRRKDFEIGGPVGQERKLTDYIEPNIKAQTNSSTPVPGVDIDEKSYEYILKLKIPLDEKLKLIAEFGGNKSITEIDDSELASRYGVKKGADIYKGGSSNKRFGAEYINDGLTFGGRYDPDSGNKNLYISKRFQDGGLATMFKLK
jgi:hypothetical protein